MATVAEYRKWADDCFEWAREASDEMVRESYAKMGQLWLEHAVRTELISGMITTAPESKTAKE